MAESFNGLYQWELIYRQGPWRGIDDVEFATMSYVDWFNHRRLHGQITDGPGYTTPAEFEADYYRQTTTRPSSRSPNEPSSHGTRGASGAIDRPIVGKRSSIESAHFPRPGRRGIGSDTGTDILKKWMSR